MRNILILCFSLMVGQEPPSPLLSSYKQYKKEKANTPYNVEWISVGPVLNSARVEAVQGDPRNPGTMYIAFGSGNLWKTMIMD